MAEKDFYIWIQDLAATHIEVWYNIDKFTYEQALAKAKVELSATKWRG